MKGVADEVQSVNRQLGQGLNDPKGLALRNSHLNAKAAASRHLRALVDVEDEQLISVYKERDNRELRMAQTGAYKPKKSLQYSTKQAKPSAVVDSSIIASESDFLGVFGSSTQTNRPAAGDGELFMGKRARGHRADGQGTSQPRAGRFPTVGYSFQMQSTSRNY